MRLRLRLKKRMRVMVPVTGMYVSRDYRDCRHALPMHLDGNHAGAQARAFFICAEGLTTRIPFWAPAPQQRPAWDLGGGVSATEAVTMANEGLPNTMTHAAAALWTS